MSQAHGPSLTGRITPLLALVAIVVAGISPQHRVGATPSGPTIELSGPTHVAVGEPIELRVTLKQSRDVAGYETTLLFDTTVAEFSEFRQRDTDLIQLGRDVTPLAAVETPYGAAIGLFTCPTPYCLRRTGATHRQGGNGTVRLGSVALVAQQPGRLEIALGATRVVDATGAPLSVALSPAVLVVQVGAEGSGPTYAAPASPWILPPTASGAQGSVELTGDGLVTHADAMEVALAWTRLREDGQACGSLPDPDRDINQDGCVDVADAQLVTANYSPAGASPNDGGAPAAPANAATAATGMVSVAAKPKPTPSAFVVNATGDQPDAQIDGKQCATAAGTCTLRAAIQEANRHVGPDSIAFNIPGTGVHTIMLSQALPTLLDESGGTTIDGYTQPGAIPNTDPRVSNAVILIHIEGAGEEQFGGLAITSAGNQIRGLALSKLRPRIHLYGTGADHNVITGSFIGTNAAGTYAAATTATGQAHGIHLEQGASGNQIGGTLPAERNVISGNGRSGIGMWHGGTNANVVLNNLVGLSPDGQRCLRNYVEGIDMNFGAANNVIGGTGPGERNVTTGNGLAGIDVSHSTSTTGNRVVGNYSGTGVAGAQAPANCTNNQLGIRIRDGAAGNYFSDNVLGNNRQAGIWIKDTTTAKNTITNNHIGVALDGTAIPNPIGILVDGHNNTIGPANDIAFNQQQGIRVSDAAADSNTLTRNAIHHNGALGIDLDPVGVTVNDTGDADTGPNQQRNAPVLTSASLTTVAGHACAGCVIEVFSGASDASGHGEGPTFVGAATAGQDGAFTVTVVGLTSGQSVTATATDPSGNTSEFAGNLQVPS